MARTRSALRPLLLAALGCALVTGCRKPPPPANSLDALDSALIDGTAAGQPSANGLAGAISVDRAKTGRHAAARGDGAGTMSLGTLAARQADERAPGGRTIESPMAGDCGGTLTYSNAWAKQLPADLPLPPGATLTEAAGKDGGCLVRVVSMTVPVGRDAIVGWYADRARAAGYTTARDDGDGNLVLAGQRARDGASLRLMVEPASGNRTPIDLIWTR